MKSLMGSALAVCLVAGNLEAQYLVKAGVSRPAAAPNLPIGRIAGEPTRHELVGAALTGAVLIGAIGGVAGYYYGTIHCSADYFCGFMETVIGAAVGESLGVPLGARAVSGKGSLGVQVFVSVAVLGLGVFAAPMTMGLSLLPVIPIQVALVVKNVTDATHSEVPR